MRQCTAAIQYFEKFIALSRQDPSILLETARFDVHNRHSFFFTDAEDILTINCSNDIDNFFNRIEYYRQRRMWLAGFFSYELGYLLEEKLNCLPHRLTLPFADRKSVV